ncbi:Plasmodium exported protein, unknown function [Plasmodium malariae]|uniref:Uncharacterized protein n=1 Tax=Plasmodium malariae TaxID=5858 RepID=A0A1D3RJR3_PLAMA|nr:Plasmodium exported protein, unknown function [Plasmodium malariae]SCN45379.1 Plasmodium exported protein, unknown function [Plasmodium malariae]
MISFILDKNIIFIFFVWIYYYFCDAHNFGKILGMKTIQNISLYSRTYRLLSKFNNEKIKVSLERNLHRNGYNDIKKKKKNCQLKNYGNSTGAEYNGKGRTKNKNNSGFEEKKLLRKCIYVLCKPFVEIDKIFEKLIYKGFIAIYEYRKCTDSIQKKNLKFSACKSAVLTFAIPSIIFVTVLSLLLLVCPPLGNLVLGESSQSFQGFMTKSEMQAFLLSLFILSITMVIYILVKFINYVIEVGGDEIGN